MVFAEPGSVGEFSLVMAEASEDVSHDEPHQPTH